MKEQMKERKKISSNKFPALERRGGNKLAFISVSVIFIQIFVIMQFSTYSTAHTQFGNFVAYDSSYQDDLYTLIECENKAALVFQGMIFKASPKDSSLKQTDVERLDNVLKQWMQFFTGIERKHKLYFTDESDYGSTHVSHALDPLKEAHAAMLTYYQGLYDALATARYQEAGAFFKHPNFVFQRYTYGRFIHDCATDMRQAYTAAHEKEEVYLIIYMALVVLMAPLLIMMWSLARESVILRHVQPAVMPIAAAVKESSVVSEYDGMSYAGDTHTTHNVFEHISYEARAPLNNILSLSTLLMDSKLDEEHYGTLRSIQGSSQVLANMVDSVLLLSCIESGTFELRSIDFDLRVCMEEATQMLSYVAESNETECHCIIDMDVPYLLHGDYTRLQHVLMNAVSQIIHRQHAEKVAICACLQSASASHIVLKILITEGERTCDNERAELIFEDMRRNAARGLDLSEDILMQTYGFAFGVSKKIIERMDGHLYVGTYTESPYICFEVRIKKQTEAIHIEQRLHKELRAKKILVAGGTASERGSMLEMLRQWGCLPSEAQDAMTTLKKLHNAARKSFPFDMVLVDTHIESMGASELIRTMQQNILLKHTHAIMILPADDPRTTASASDSGIRRELSLATYVSKPIEPPDLYEALARVMKKKKRSDSRTSTRIIARNTYKQNQQSGYRILLVEDDAMNRRLTQRLLKKCAYTVDIVENGSDACQQYIQYHYDLILMDCHMPIMDGYEATQQIRARESNKERIPIIAMTSHTMDDDRAHCLAVGMDDYLPKPFKIEALLGMLTKWLNPDSQAPKESALERKSSTPD